MPDLIGEGDGAEKVIVARSVHDVFKGLGLEDKIS